MTWSLHARWQGPLRARVARAVAWLAPVIAATAASTPPSLEHAQWIWSPEAASACHLRTVFKADAVPLSAVILITADNGYDLSVNGARVGGDAGAASEVWQSVERYDITSRLVKGWNSLGVLATDLGGERGLIAALRLEWPDGRVEERVTDAGWHATASEPPVDCSHPEFVEGPEWAPARIVGPYGMPPWGNVAWSADGARARARKETPIDIRPPPAGFVWPSRVAFLGTDCSVYVPLRADAWGVAFRVGDWSRAYTEFDLPCPSKIGRTLHLLDPGPGVRSRVLLDAGAGVLGSPAASYDGRSILVAAALGGDRFFHIHRVPVDGGPPVRLTSGPFHDIDPAELPDGRIVFTSTRAGSFEEYHQPPSRALFRMNADGTDIHPITSTLIFDNEPKVMADGRIAFIRTDNFFDRGKVETHLHVIRPDGTDGFAEVAANVGPDYGVRLRAFGYGSPAPLPDGRIACISSRGNLIATPGGRERDFHPLPGSLGDLAPLPDGRLLCTVLRPHGVGRESDVLGVIDPRDNVIVSLHESAAGAIHSPVFVGARPRPPVIPDYVDRAAADRPGATGFLLCQDARITTKSKAGWSRVRAIRVLGAAPLTVRSSHSHIVHVGHETVELGTVPLASDGSFYIEVPADTPIALQAVDAEGRSELNEMSWMYVRPGERRSCIGCHQPRQAVPVPGGGTLEALRSPPLRVTGQGDPHRFRGNNPGVTGMMDLQFERFRECASLNRSVVEGSGECSEADLPALLIQRLRNADAEIRLSASQRLALLRERSAAPGLAALLQDPVREVRIAAGLALAACGDRSSVPPLLAALQDRDPAVVRAAEVALENLTGHPAMAAEWPGWIHDHAWDTIEVALVRQLHPPESATNGLPSSRGGVRAAVVALGHTAGATGREALREFIRQALASNPYPPFEKDNRTDNFTFDDASRLNPRTLQEAIRALGQLHDTASVPVLREWVATQASPRTGNLFAVEAAVEALGRIGGPDAESALIDAFARLGDYWDYVGWYSDHPALYACHSSPVHARILEALDRLGSPRAGPVVERILRSVPTDPDRGLFPWNDEYELTAGRVIRRSGRGVEVTEACLAILGDPAARRGSPALVEALTTTHAAWAGHPGATNRAAQLISLVCRDAGYEPRVRAAFERILALPEEPVHRALGNPDWTPVRHWTLFYLARALGNLRSAASVPALAAVLGDRLNEARLGRPDPASPEIHFLQLDYTPCWRAAVAWALGEIRDPRAAAPLLGAVRNLDNAGDVRHAAARALRFVGDFATVADLQALGAGYPDVRTRKALLRTREILDRPPAAPR